MEQPHDQTGCSLILSPDANTAFEACGDSFNASELPDAAALLVTYGDPERHTKWARALEQNGGGHPGQLKVIYVGDTVRSASSVATGDPIGSGGKPIKTVGDPADLARLGITISGLLGRSEVKKEDGGPNEFVVCFDSLTHLLQYVALEKAFQFLHVLIGRLQETGAVAYFRLDPDAHDERTIATLRPLFDTVIEDKRATECDESRMDDRPLGGSVQRAYDWSTTSPAMAVLETIAELDHGSDIDAESILAQPLQTYLNTDALNDFVRSDAAVSVTLSVPDHHVQIHGNTVWVIRTKSNSDTRA